MAEGKQDMRYQWAEGFHPPKGVSVDALAAAVDELSEPSPESLLGASKRKRHVLHEELWAEGDQLWASRGRLERCRRILGGYTETIVAGGKTIEIRAVEFVRTNGTGQWTTIENIRSDPELMDAYAGEISRLMDQASAKMEKYRELLKSE